MLLFCSPKVRMALDAVIEDQAHRGKGEESSRAKLIAFRDWSARKEAGSRRSCGEETSRRSLKDRRRTVRCRAGTGESE